jgi:hypothetical protein
MRALRHSLRALLNTTSRMVRRIMFLNVYRMDEEYVLKPAWSLFDEQRCDARCEHCNRDADTVIVILIDVSCTQLLTIGSKKIEYIILPRSRNDRRSGPVAFVHN